MNIYKELGNCIDGFIIPDHGYLEGWARQGNRIIYSLYKVYYNN